MLVESVQEGSISRFIARKRQTLLVESVHEGLISRPGARE